MKLPRPMKISRWTAVLAALLAIGWYTMRDNPDGGGIGPMGLTINADNPTQVALGRKVYQAECASCHGVNLEGQPDWRTRNADGRLPAPPHDATGHTWHHSDATLFAVTKYGAEAVTGQPYETDMPVYNGVLTDEEIAASLAYIKSTWPADIRARHDAMNTKMREQAAQ